MEREVPVAELHGVPGVVPAVVARGEVETVGEEIDDLPLPLVSPLTAENGCDFHDEKRGSVADFDGRFQRRARSPGALRIARCEPSV
jgi:hypothetical protein